MTQIEEPRHAFPLYFKSFIAQNGEVLIVQFDRQNAGRSFSDNALGQLAAWLDEAEARERPTVEQLAVPPRVESTTSRAERGCQTLRREIVVCLSQVLKVSPSRLPATADDA